MSNVGNLATVSPWMRHLLMEDFDNYTKTLVRYGGPRLTDPG